MAQATKDQKGNQSEGEFFAIEKQGRDGVQEMIDRMGGEIVEAAAAHVRQHSGVWLQRAMLSVVNNPQMKDVLSHRRGMYSVYKCFAKAAQMGLQLGGQFPHAHLVPFGNKSNNYAKEAELVPTAEGYRFAAVHGAQPVLRDVVVRPVYEGDDISIDQGKGTVSHKVDPTKERGKMLGVYGILTRLDGGTVVEWLSLNEVHKVRNAHSLAWQKGWDTAWKSDPEAMAMKTAAKRFLKPYAAEAEGLAMLMATEDVDGEDPPASSPRDVTDRTNARLDERLGDMPSAPEAASEPPPERNVSHEQEQSTTEEQSDDDGDDSGQQDIF